MEAAPGEDTGPWIRVLTLNARQGFRAGGRQEALLRIRDGLRASQADLVFLQEIGSVAGAGSSRQQYEVLADGVWTQHAYGRNAVKTGGHHGNALLSKYPIESWRNVDVSVGLAEPRGLLHAVIGLTDGHGPLHAICLHLALRESHRRWQVDRLLECVAHELPRDAALVIAGDFNDWRESAHHRLVHDGGLEEVHAAVDGRPARTFPARAPWLRLDRIYVRNVSHRPLEIGGREWRTLSDHRPLAAELRYGGRPVGIHGERLQVLDVIADRMPPMMRRERVTGQEGEHQRDEYCLCPVENDDRCENRRTACCVATSP